MAIFIHDQALKTRFRCDYYVAGSFGCGQSFPHNVQLTVWYPAFIKSPLLYSQITFLSVATELKLEKETAFILDEMSFLIQTVIRQLHHAPNETESVKLEKTAIWARNRIADLSEGNDNHLLSNDFLYKSCRIASLIYCRAIAERIPLSLACTVQDLDALWINMWQITLTRWKEIPGIFLFVILSANQAAQNTPHGRLSKSMFKASSSYIALDNWDVVDGALMSYLKLQTWLGDARVKEESAQEPRYMEFLHVYN